MTLRSSAHLIETQDRLRWLQRYARYQGVPADACGKPEQVIKRLFSLAAWRIVCRSPKSVFLPILQNRRLGFHHLVSYAQGLADHGFRVAPPAPLLLAFIRSSFAFFDQAPAVPVAPQDLSLLRMVSAQGRCPPKQLHLVQQWLHAGHVMSARMRWEGVLKRASLWHARQLAHMSHMRWTFACAQLDWFGLEIVPLAAAVDLWDEGQAMSTCLYRLRTECDADSASRFFSVRKNGRRYATLELSCLPDAAVPGGIHRYQLRDCRLSVNRLPPADLVAVLRQFADHYQRLAHRQGLLPQANQSGPNSQQVKKLWGGVAWPVTPAKRR